MSIIKKIKEKGIKGCIKSVTRFYTITYGYKINISILKAESNLYSFKKLDKDLLKRISIEYTNEVSLKKIEHLNSRLENDAKEKPYVVIDHQGSICGYFHISYTNTFDSSINSIIELESNSVYLFDDYTFSKYRGKGVHKFAVHSRLSIAKKEGYKVALVNIIKNNIPSEKTYKQIGFVKYKKYTYIHLGYIKKTFKKDLL